MVRAVQANGRGALRTGVRSAKLRAVLTSELSRMEFDAAPQQLFVTNSPSAMHREACKLAASPLHVEQVEAEEVEDLAERYDVSAVPHFLILKVRLPLCMLVASCEAIGTCAMLTR